MNEQLEYDERIRLHRFCFYFEQCYDAAMKYYGEKDSLPLPNAMAVAAFCADSFRARETRDNYILHVERLGKKFRKLFPDVAFDDIVLISFWTTRKRVKSGEVCGHSESEGPSGVSLLVGRHNGYATRIRRHYNGCLVDGTKAPTPDEWTDETYMKVDPSVLVKFHKCGKGSAAWLENVHRAVKAYTEFCENHVGEVEWLCEHVNERRAL